MAVFEVISRVTHKSLMNKTKHELAHMVLELMCKDRGPRLSAKAIYLVRETIEAEEAVGSAAVATALKALLDWHGDAE